MPEFDYVITMGNVLTVIGFFVSVWAAFTHAFHQFDKRIAHFEEIMKGHSDTLLAHAKKMERQDELLLKLVGDVQRLIGVSLGASVNYPHTRRTGD